MKKVGIITKKGMPGAVNAVRGAVKSLRKKGFEVFVESELASDLKITGYQRNDIPAHAEMIIVLGGDGTLLHAAGLIGGREIPILGVNLGGLGFITEITLNEIPDAINKIASGKYSLEERIMLSARVDRRGKQVFKAGALNDVVIHKSALARMIEFDARVDRREVTTLRADGLIIATPTGSTAHSLSAGGPILYPTLGAFVVTPICPHTLTNRPIVLPDKFILEVSIKMGDEVYLTLDGQVGFPLKVQDTVKVRKAGYKTKFIRLSGRDYFEVLRTKLKWGKR
ncbi:MAG: NAD(+)/NADH kinase [Nitrospirae bacterium]|nr:NAD(+)/NADH kinase [Nitrospirota bacterium]